MKKEKEWDKVGKAAGLLLKMGTADHVRPKKPTKKDLNRRFLLGPDKKGNPEIIEVLQEEN